MAGARWVKLDTDYFGNPKSRTAGAIGRALHIASVCWSGQHLTDGRVPSSAVDVLLAAADVPGRAISAVVNAGLWVPTDHGFEIHDYLEHNQSRELVERERERWREAKRRK